MTINVVRLPRSQMRITAIRDQVTQVLVNPYYRESIFSWIRSSGMHNAPLSGRFWRRDAGRNKLMKETYQASQLG